MFTLLMLNDILCFYVFNGNQWSEDSEDIFGFL